MSAPITTHLATLANLSAGQIHELLLTSAHHKYRSNHLKLPSADRPLAGKTVAILFSKRSTRTRLATETAVAYLGGHAVFLGATDIQLGVNESFRDTATVVGSMADGIMARVDSHTQITELARHSRAPVINALSDDFHPTQILADLLTMHELALSPAPYAPEQAYTAHEVHPSKTLPGLRCAWVGDANNILHSMMVAFPKMGIQLVAATPAKYPVSERMKALATEAAAGNPGCEVVYTHSPAEAVRGADYIITDTWVSMGQEEEKAQRLADFAGFQVTEAMASEGGAKVDWKFLHCLPRKPEEVDDATFYGTRSQVWQEAENRKWTIMAIMEALVGHGKWKE